MPDLSFSVTAPLHLQTADGQKFDVSRWSLADVWFDHDAPDVSGWLTLVVPFQGVDVQFPIQLKETDTIGQFTFHNMTVRQRETLSLFYKGILSGQMVSTDAIITSLDTPVDLVPMGETEEEMSAGMAKVKPRILRIIWNIMFYALLSLFLVGFVGGQIWNRLSHISLEHSRFLAPIEQYSAPETALVEQIYVRAGDTVKVGDKLVRLQDPDRESDVNEVRAEVQIAERRLETDTNALARHISLRETYRKPLWDAFYTLWTPWKSHEPRALTYPSKIQTAWDALRRFDLGLDLTPGGYYDLLAEYERRVADSDLTYRRWKRDLRQRKSAADELLIRATSDGTVFAVHTQTKRFAAREELLIEIEDDAPRVAVGWLDDSMAGTVYIGMTANVSYSYRGQSKSIEGEIIDLQAGVDSVQPDKFGMIVTIKAKDAGLKNTRKWFRPNAPARIKLNRDLISKIWRGAADGRS
jgi:multidrug resistance efflux pump